MALLSAHETISGGAIDVPWSSARITWSVRQRIEWCARLRATGSAKACFLIGSVGVDKLSAAARGDTSLNPNGAQSAASRITVQTTEAHRAQVEHIPKR